MKTKILQKVNSLFVGAALLTLVTSCTPDEEASQPANGYLSFTISNSIEQNANGRLSASEEDYRYLIVSVKDENGEYVLNNQRLELTKLGDGYFTENIMFKIGAYAIEDFIVLDSDENAILLAPKEATKYEEYVEDALPVGCTVTRDETIVRSVEVLDVTLDEDPAEFGYAILTFNVVNPVNIENGLIAHYDFNGDATDKSGNGFHAMVYGASLTASRKGQSEGAYRFDGSGDYMNTSISDSVLTGLESFSFGCWVKFDSLNNSRQVMISNTVDGNAMWALRLEGNQISTGIVTQQDSSAVRWTQLKGNNTDQAVIQHNWYHLVTVYDGELMRLYVNGVEMLSTSATGPLVRQSSGTKTVHLGSPANRRVDYMLEGVLDDVRIYSRALNPLEIQSLYSE